MESSIPPLPTSVFVEVHKCVEDLIKSCQSRAFHEEDASSRPVKKNFTETYEREEFLGKTNAALYDR